MPKRFSSSRRNYIGEVTMSKGLALDSGGDGLWRGQTKRTPSSRQCKGPVSFCQQLTLTERCARVDNEVRGIGMSYRTPLSGRFTRKNLAHLSKRAGETYDARHVFYKAMLEHHTYEKYLEHVGELKVHVPTFKDGPISGRREMLYARQNGWIVNE